MALVLVTAPASEPVSATEAKAMLGIGAEVTDTVMGVFVTAARQMIDGSNGWIGRCLVNQTWDLLLDAFPWQDYYALAGKGYYDRPSQNVPYTDLLARQRQGIVIPLAPVTQPIVYIKYTDDTGTEQTLDPANYVLVPGEPARVALSFNGAWPSAALVPGSVKVRFIAGYGADGSAVPQIFRTAIALQASHLRSLAARNLFISTDMVDGVGSTSYVVGNGAGNAIDATVQALLGSTRVVLS
jgi:hypothetical protein